MEQRGFFGLSEHLAALSRDGEDSVLHRLSPAHL